LGAGYQFDIVVPDESVEQGICSDCSPAEYVSRLAQAKAANVALKTRQGIIIAADTVAECRGQILGKPRDADHARSMLHWMSGQVHRVLTGVCIWTRPENRIELMVDVTELRMDLLSESMIEDYLASDQWIGKAGAFGFQDGLDWVQIVRGSASNVIGLPMEKLTRTLNSIS
jgi:septum formation protein